MSILQLKRNDTGSPKVPTSGQLAAGEPAIDLATGVLYIGTDAGPALALGINPVIVGSVVNIPASGSVSLTIPDFITDAQDAVVDVKIFDGGDLRQATPDDYELVFTTTTITLTNKDTTLTRQFRYKILRA